MHFTWNQSSVEEYNCSVVKTISIYSARSIKAQSFTDGNYSKHVKTKTMTLRICHALPTNLHKKVILIPCIKCTKCSHLVKETFSKWCVLLPRRNMGQIKRENKALLSSLFRWVGSLPTVSGEWPANPITCNIDRFSLAFYSYSII